MYIKINYICRLSNKVFSYPLNFQTSTVIEIKIMYRCGKVVMRFSMRLLIKKTSGVNVRISKTVRNIAKSQLQSCAN